MNAQMAIKISNKSCIEEIDSVLNIVNDAAHNNMMDVSIPFELKPPTIHYLRKNCNFVVDGDNSSWHMEKGKKCYWTISWR